MYKPICVIEDCPDFGRYCRRPFHTAPEVKVKKAIPKVSDKKKQELTELKENPENGYAHWFVAQRVKMTGKCCNCGQPSSKNNDTFFTFSIAHILPKSKFPSVGKHPDNWIELCVDCHTKFDSSISNAIEMPCFELAVEKFQLFRAVIAEDEIRRIPEAFTY